MEANLSKEFQDLGQITSLNKSVLVAEDNDVNFMVFEAFLTDWGYEVTRASNGKEAITLVNQKKFNVILMDLYMPEMNGLDAIKNIRKKGHTMPIIVLTASSLEKDLKDALANGANDYLLKPVSGVNLKAILAKHSK